MPVYEVMLQKREAVAEGTMAFQFVKPPDFHFKAGQSIRVTLIDPPQTDAEGNARTFSLVSAPFETELVIATRMRDTAFKRVLQSLSLGSAVKIEGPDGVMTLHDDPSRPAAFLAGGIGITPFVSMLRQAAGDQLPHRLYLFYSNRRPEDAAFLAELQQLEQENRNYRFIGTMTGMEKSRRTWEGETGFIDGNMLARHIGDMAAPIYYMAGPPAMAFAMQEMLHGAAVSDDAIRSEEFYGY